MSERQNGTIITLPQAMSYSITIGRTRLYIHSIHQYLNHRPFWTWFRPQYRRYWSGAIINIGLAHWYLVIDRRNIRTAEDFKDEMALHPDVNKAIRPLR